MEFMDIHFCHVKCTIGQEYFRLGGGGGGGGGG